MSYGAAIDALSTPPVKRTLTVTIPEGYTRSQAAQVVEEAGVPGDYTKATVKSKYLDPAEYGGKKAKDLEGFLFPDTFELKPKAPVADLVQLQLQDFKRRIKGVDMSYAKSKNLTVFDVVTIASMIEDEAGVDAQRGLVASVIYNRLHEGMPLGIDATIRFATGNYTKPLTESELAIDSPYNTPHQRRPAAGADQQPRPRIARGRRAPAEDRLPLLRDEAGSLRQARPSPRPKPNSKPPSTSTTPLAKRPAATSRTAARNSRAKARGARPSRLALALAGDAERGAGGAGAGTSGSYERDRRRPRGLRDDGCRRAGRSRLRRRQRDRPAQGGGAGAGRRSERSLAARSAPPTPSSSTAGGSRPTTPTPTGCWRRCRTRRWGRARWCSGPAGPPGRRSGRCSGKGRRSRSGTARRSGPRRSAPSSVARRSTAPRQGEYDLIVNTSAAGLRRRRPVRGAAAGAGRVHRPPDRRRHGLRRAPQPLLKAAEGAGAAVVDGLEILVQQGARSLEIWTGREPPTST